MRPNSDSFLVWRISRWNDRKAANDLAEKYYREIYAFTYRQTLEKQLALDLTQEIFISVLQSAGGFEPKKGSFRTWLYRIASRRLIRLSQNWKTGIQHVWYSNRSAHSTT